MANTPHIKHGEDYVSFLEKQLQTADEERRLMIEEFNKVRQNFAEINSLRQDVKEAQLQKEITRQELSQEVLVLQEEREKVARLMSENAVLHAQMDDDRAKICSLLQITRADGSLSGLTLGGIGCNNNNNNIPNGGSDVFYSRHLFRCPTNANADARRVERKLKEEMSTQADTQDNTKGSYPHISKHKSVGARAGHRGSDSMSLRCVVTDFTNSRTINNTAIPTATMLLSKDQEYFPTDGLPPQALEAINAPPGSSLVAALSQEVHTLTQQLDEQRKAYEYERSLRIADEKRRIEEMSIQNRDQTAKIARLEEDCTVAVKELCLYRHNQQIVERSLRAEIDKLQMCCIETTTHYTSKNTKETSDLKLALELAVNKTNTVTSHLKEEITMKRHEFLKEKEVLEDTIRNLRDANSVLEKDLRQEKAARRRAEERFRLEKEGTSSEILLLKQQLRAVEKKKYFSHQKGEQEVNSAAKLLSLLVSEQFQQQMQTNAGTA